MLLRWWYSFSFTLSLFAHMQPLFRTFHASRSAYTYIPFYLENKNTTNNNSITFLWLHLKCLFIQFRKCLRLRTQFIFLFWLFFFGGGGGGVVVVTESFFFFSEFRPFSIHIHLIESMYSADFHRQYIDQNSDSGKNNVFLRIDMKRGKRSICLFFYLYTQKKFMRKFESINIKLYTHTL